MVQICWRVLVILWIAIESKKLKEFVCDRENLNSSDWYVVLYNDSSWSCSNRWSISLIQKQSYDDGFPRLCGSCLYFNKKTLFRTYNIENVDNKLSIPGATSCEVPSSFDFVSSSDILYSEIPFYDEDGNKHSFDTDNIVPFTVSTSPSLGLNMSRTGTLVAPGSSNDGTQIENNSLAVTVSLTDEFIKLRNSDDELKDYTYEFICYLTTSPPESSYADSLKNAVYTYLHYGDYMYTTSGVVADVTDDYGEPTNWICATGINAGNIIPKGGKTKNITINLENVDSSKFTDDTKLYLVVYGRLTSMNAPTPDYFDLQNQGYLCNQGSLNTQRIITINANDKTGEGTDVYMPDYYCSTSSAFSYVDYPDYKPLVINGKEIDTNKPVTDYLDKKITPDTLKDYDMDSKGEKGLPPDEFEEYEKNKKLSENYSSFNFDATSLNEIFKQTGSFFKFLTACIQILPSYFLTVLISFFTVMLAIVVIKLVL